MRTQDLAALVAVTDTGSVTAAARRLGYSQPAVSRQLQRLEDEVAVPLLERHAHGMRLTSAGERLVAYARERVEAEAALIAEVRIGEGQLRGVVRIAASTIPGDFLVPELTARFAEQQPHVRTEVEVLDSATVMVTLLEGGADVGFVGHAQPDPRLTYVPVAADEVVLAVPASHPLASEATVPLAALEGERLIWREEGSGTQRTFMDALARHDVELPTSSSTASLGSTQAVVAAVRAGLGVGVVSSRVFAREPHDDIAPVRIAGLPLWRRLWLVYQTRRARAAHHAAFIAFATDAAAEA